MRFRGVVGFLILLAIAFTACEEDRFFNIDTPEALSFTSEGSEKSFNISTNMEWSVSSTEPWCVVTPSSGISSPDGLVVKVICEPNDSPEARQCMLTFVTGESIVNVAVKQDFKTMFSVSETSFNVSDAYSKLGVGVSTTEDYDVEISPDAKSWISVISTRSLSRDSVYFTVAANDTYSSRKGEIVLKQRYSGNTETIVVNQRQNDFVGVSQEEFEVGSEGETVELAVTSNLNWEVVIPKDAKSWVKVDSDASTRALTEGSLHLVVSANTKYTGREAVLTVRQKGGGYSSKVVIRQHQKDRLVVSTKKYSLTHEAHSLVLKVTSNVEWELVVPDDAKDWISGDSTSVSIAANKALTDRQAWVYLVQTDGALKDSVSITQAREPLIKVQEPKIISGSKQYVEVIVESNVGYDVKPSVKWITCDNGRSHYPERLVFYVSANSVDRARKGTVVLKQKSGTATCEFTIRQRPTSYLETAIDTLFFSNKAGEALVKVSTNLQYEVVVPEDCDWLSVISAPQVGESLSDVSVAVKVDQNNLFVDRSAPIVLRQTNGTLSRKVVVSQAQSPLNPDSEYIAVFGDIQYYTNAGKIDLFKTSLRWISAQVENGYKFNCVLHTGDVTHNCNLNLQWNYFGAAIKEFYSSKVPFISAIGDHDYKWPDGVHIKDRDDTYFSWFLTSPTTKVVAWFEPDRMENVVVANFIHGKPYYILCLEFGPRKEVVEWAAQYIQSHQDRKFILLNHEYMENGGGFRVKDLKCKLRIQNSSYLTPTQLWEALVKPNDNVAWVICGHVGSLYSYMETPNVMGREVPQIQHNIQATQYMDDNWLMLWEFPKDGVKASVKIVNTASGELYDGKEELFSFKYLY